MRGATEGRDSAAEGAGLPDAVGHNATHPIRVSLIAGTVMPDGFLAYYLQAVPFIFWVFKDAPWPELLGRVLFSPAPARNAGQGGSDGNYW